MPDCVGKHNNEKTPDCWMHNEAKKEQLVDTCPAGHKPGGKAIPQESPSVSVVLKMMPCSSTTSKQGLTGGWQQTDSSSQRKGLSASRRHQEGVDCNNHST